ncbi:MAG: 4Fe-4S dicluster domain-containing protein [Methylovirgula sp.]
MKFKTRILLTPTRTAMQIGEKFTITHDGLAALIAGLRRRGFRVIGPRLRDQAIVYDDIETLADLPQGLSDVQDGGRYRVIERGDDKLFGYAVGPQSWKQFLHPPMLSLWRAEKRGKSFEVKAPEENLPRFAFLGVRSCELHAIAIQDRVFLGGAIQDPHYRRRRVSAFIIAVNCSHAGGTCFCVSMQTGPKAEAGFDLALTEIGTDHTHAFLVEIGSAEGAECLADAMPHAAGSGDVRKADVVVAHTADHMGREMPAADVAPLLARNLDHARWDEVAERCLACANCTMVCPTCFCTSVEDASELSGEAVERRRRWDSCFTTDFSYLHGGSVRQSTKSRYRQWLTHKLSSWVDQFGTSGCVGCGRCISWCPVGIDITEEVQAIQASEAGTPSTEDTHSG